MPSTLADLEAAKQELEIVQRRYSNYNGNNPHKFRSQLRYAANRVEHIEEDLKAAGVLPRTEKEELEAALDAAFPRARSREIVTYQGKRYQRRFYPAAYSNSGKTVTQWDRWWEPVK